MKNTYQILEDLLITQEKYKSLENNNILKTKIYEDAYNLDADLLELLLSNNEVNKIFFREVNKIKVFDSQKFISFINSKNFLPDSYTKYCNKIGLTHNNNFISKNNDVVLDFPYKDCVLAGGQTKDDQKREEIAFNEIIARDEIGRMLAPKVFTNAKRYTKDGVEENIEFNEDDNLIIKGNNLIALSSILERYEGKVKCIYIDPPYNTGNDSFNYNDRFNHSTWLTFMKNRLEVARKFLKDDGVIFIQCDDNEQAYLKVLCDEIFGRENFVGCLIHQRAKGGGNAKNIVKGHDYILIYAKNLSIEHRFIREKVIQKKVIERDGAFYIRDDDVIRKTFGKYDKSMGNRRCFYDEINIYKTPSQIQELEKKLESGELVLEDYGNGKQVFVSYTAVENSYSKLYSIIKALSEDGTNHLSELGLDFYSPKPEELLNFIIFSCTNTNDLIMDFHLGSGTTCAVAHKMKRRYIGIEQMDYINTVTVPRLEKVINGDRGGHPSY